MTITLPKLRIELSPWEFSVFTFYFSFTLANYCKCYWSMAYWKGVEFAFRWPWEKIEYGSSFPHGISLITDILGDREQQLTVGRYLAQ